MSDSIHVLPFQRLGQQYQCQARYGFFRNGMPCYLLDILDASGQLFWPMRLHRIAWMHLRHHHRLAVLMARVADSDWLRGLDEVLARRARGELALPAWFNLSFEQL